MPVNPARAVVLLLLVFSFLYAEPALAQASPLSLGNVGAVNPMQQCPKAYATGAECFQTTVSCPNTEDLEVTYGVLNPEGISRGTIVLLRGSGGTLPGMSNYATAYVQEGFRVLQMAWASNWEDTGLPAKSIKTAACRAATLLNYFHQNYYEGNGGMCAQGFSAGSAQIVYSLTAYGSSGYLDKVELLSGPVFGDISQGCRTPPAPQVTVCAKGQYDCSGPPWADQPQYVTELGPVLSTFTGHNCLSKIPSSPQDSAAWKAMSIVDGTSAPVFYYAQTALAGWLCSNHLNNSAAQGQIFYQNFTQPNQATHYSLTRIDGCVGAEGVDTGTTPDGESGFVAITADMVDPVVGCIKRH